MAHTNPDIVDPRIRKMLADQMTLIHNVQKDLERKGFCTSREMRHYYHGELLGARGMAEEIQYALDHSIIK